MSCDDWRQKMDTYVDVELAPAEARQFEAHLRDCPACSAEALARSQLKRSVHLAGRAFLSDAKLREKIHGRIRPRTSALGWSWIPQIAVALIAIVLVVAGSVAWVQRRQSEQLIGELTDLHVATLASANRVDVISSDRHTVKPWFQGRIPFTFNVPELGDSRFVLIGGKITYLDQNPGAELLFAVRKHLISLFIFKDSAPLDRALGSAEGLRKLSFNVESWSDNGLRYIAVTDATRSDLDDLHARFVAAAK